LWRPGACSLRGSTPRGSGARCRGSGTLEPGKLADLVVLQGDLTTTPAAIRNVTIVFKDGVGYDSAKLIASVQERVGIN
jgi:cytosine/adenosine deaminase-related metal-dependent hydrolase